MPPNIVLVAYSFLAIQLLAVVLLLNIFAVENKNVVVFDVDVALLVVVGGMGMREGDREIETLVTRLEGETERQRLSLRD
jgi:hypothetical protein